MTQSQAAALPMRQKTYLSPEQQWDRSIKLIDSHRKLFVNPHRLGVDLQLGKVVRTHKLFRTGDVVFVVFTSWKRDRCRIAAISSKGYTVLRFFIRLCQANSGQPKDHGPVQLVDLPDHQTNKRPDDPAVRQFVVGPLRAGDAACSGRRA
jgi:hypothetical protein